MDINYLRSKKRQKYLIVILGVILLITAIVIWFGFLKEEKTTFIPASDISAISKDVVIDFEFLKSQELEEMDFFDNVPEFDGKEGRKNPFTKPRIGETPPNNQEDLPVVDNEFPLDEGFSPEDNSSYDLDQELEDLLIE